MKISLIFSLFLLFGICFSQQPEPPKLLFREDWNEEPPYDLMTPYSFSQIDVMNTDLVLKLYGTGQDSLKKRHHGTKDDAYYLFTGFCRSTWALTLTNKNFYADLTGNAVIRCRMMNSGFRELHIVIRLGNGTWLVSDLSEGSSSVWQVHDFIIKDIRWSLLNIETIIEGKSVDNPDLSRVDEIGFTDLMSGGFSAACSRVDWIEVYADSVKR
jgi:hypothetical protein